MNLTPFHDETQNLYKVHFSALYMRDVFLSGPSKTQEVVKVHYHKNVQHVSCHARIGEAEKASGPWGSGGGLPLIPLTDLYEMVSILAV